MSNKEITLILHDGQEERISSTFNKSLLENASPYFEAMFSPHFVESNKSTVEITCEYPACLEVILDAVCRLKNTEWKSTVEKFSANPMGLLITSSVFQFDELTSACETYIIEEWLSFDNCLTTYMVTSALQLDKLNYYIITMCQRDFDRIIQTSSFLQLSYDQVQRYLKMANILVKDELNLLKVICKWIDHDLTTRSNHAKDLLENVHYARLSADEIRDLNVNYKCLDECEEAKTFLNIISCAKLDKYHDLKCDEVEVAKLHLEKPARRVKREYYLICEFKKIDDDDGYYCGEELKVIHYDVANHDQQNEIKISAIKETRIESMENKLFQNISLLNRFFFIGLNQIAEINHHHEIKIYQIARSVWYLQGNWWFTSKKEDSREVTYLVNLETKMWHQCPMTGFDFFSVERVCIHREYFFMIGENKRGAFIKSMNLSDNSWKESNVILHSPVKLVLSSQDNIYVITDKMDLHKIVTDEGVVTKSELLGSIPVKKKKKLWYDAVGTVDDGIIYMWVKSDYIVTLYTYDIKQKSFAVKRKDKIVKELEFTMDQPDFTMLNIFNPLLAPM